MLINNSCLMEVNETNCIFLTFVFLNKRKALGFL